MADIVITELVPSSAPIYGAPFTMTVNGSGFEAGCKVLWADQPLPVTNFINAGQLTTTVDPGSAPYAPNLGQAPVSVTNIAGDVSNSLTFQFTADAPVLDSLAPASIDISSGADVECVMNGSNFWPFTQLYVNGSIDECEFVDNNHIKTIIRTSTAHAASNLQMELRNGDNASAILPLALTGTPAPQPPDEGKSPNTTAIPAVYMSPEPPDVYQKVATPEGG